MMYNPSRRTLLKTVGLTVGATALGLVMDSGTANASDSPSDVVQAMLATLAAGKADQAASFFAPDAVYLSVALPPAIVGWDAILAGFRFYATLVNNASITTIRQLAQGSQVMNERVDTYTFISDGQVINLPVMGYFNVSEGLITTWSDYFDLAQSGLATHL